MPELGSTYRCNHEPRHIWVIISNPSEHENQFLFVNFTSLTPRCVDNVCILQPSDYPPYLTQPTTVAYSRAHIGYVDAMQFAIRGNHLVEMPPIPASTLTKIINGARITPQLSRAKKALLPAP